MTAEFAKLKNRSMEGIILPDAAPKCKWALDKSTCSGPSPHTHNPPRVPIAHNSIVPSVLEAYGHTPLIRLNRIPQEQGVECDILVKCEFLNPGGSIKDRIAVRMIEEAEKCGDIKPGCTLIEPTSGNTGIGLAMVAAIKGYRLILVMLEKNSLEKDVVLKALGAEIVRVPTAPFGTPDHYISIAHRLKRDIPNSYIFDQYKNPWNAIAHYDTTGEEILTQTDGKVDMVVIGSGTCGTITGVARKIKERVPSCKIVGIDPHGSVLAYPKELNEGPTKSYLVEGIGKKFVPANYDVTVTDKWYKTDDAEGFEYARKLVKLEGLLCGGSCGSAVSGAIRAVKDFGLKKGQRCVVILPDSIRNYMSRYVNDDWMIDNGFMEVPDKLKAQWWWDKPISVLELSTPPTLLETSTCFQAVKTFADEKVDYVPVLGKQGDLCGVVSMKDLTLKLSTAVVTGSEPVSKVMNKKPDTMDVTGSLGILSRKINRGNFVVITKGDFTPGTVKKTLILGLVTGTDLLSYIASPPIQNGFH